MIDGLIRKTTIVSLCFSAVAIGFIMFFSATKTIEISNLSQDEVLASTKLEEDNMAQGLEAIAVDSKDVRENELKFSDDNANTEYLCIPLPEKTKVEDILIENHYMDGILYVIIPDEDKEFYQNTVLDGNRRSITGAFLEEEDGVLKLRFDLDELYEFKTILENNTLYISFFKPRELYDQIVVIDPACGGQDTGDSLGEQLEKDINLSVAKALKTKLDATGIKVYYTRMDDVNPSLEARIDIANKSKADAYIRIETDYKDDSQIYGVTAVYNDEYFIPGFGNVELSDLLEREIVTSVKGKALGIEVAGERDYTLKYATVPATIIRVGCLSNTQEAILLGREDYINRIADGMFQAIMKMYEGK